MKPYYQDGAVTIYHGACGEVMDSLPPLSVDLVLTDPPYADEYAYVWPEFAYGASVLMREGTSLFTYCGHHQIPLVIGKLSSWLKFQWLCIQRNAGGINPILHGRGVKVNYKPVLWFVKGHHARRNVILDDDLGRLGKSWTEGQKLHKWAQPVCPSPILKMSDPGQVVLDPFAGSGSTLRAAKDLGRKAIGIEIDERYAEIAAMRCAQEVLELSA